MSDTEASRTLLARLAWRFHPRMEEVAVAALAYMLNSSHGGHRDPIRRDAERL